MRWDGDIVRALSDLARFYRQLRLEGHADQIEGIIQRFIHEGQEAVTPELTGITLWGGAGSHFDLSICPENFHFLPGDIDIVETDKEHGRLLFRLAETLKQAGLSSYWLDNRYEILKKWYEKG